MRTVGTINDVYEVAKLDSNGVAPCNVSDPEVRYYGEQWALESSLSSAEDCEATCSLEAFQIFFYDSFSDDSYKVSTNDESDFLEMITKNML